LEQVRASEIELNLSLGNLYQPVNKEEVGIKKSYEQAKLREG